MAAVPGYLAVIALALFAPRAHAQTAVPAPISYYSFDEAAGSTTLFDSIRGTSGNGTLYGFGGSGGAFVPGLVGNALRFNGSSTYVTAPLAGGGLSEYTFSAWVNLDSLTNWAVVLSNWGSTSVGANILARQDNGTNWADFIGLSSGSYLFATTPSGAVVTNTWTNLITTVSQSSGQGKLYLNGTLVDTQSFSGSINSSKPIMSFGMKLNDANNGPGAPPGYLDGRLDEFAFWDSALSASQVANIYSSGTSGSTPIPVPPSTAYWAPGAGAGGTDTWSGSQGTTFWAPNSDGSGTKQPWNNGLASSVAVFGGTPGTVTTSGTVQSNQLSFTTSGYTVAGGSGSRIDFIGSNPAIQLASGVTTTISANLGGGGPLAITGTGSRGTATLGGTVTTTGGVTVTNALLSLSGTVQGNVSLAASAALGGTGRINGTVSGAGTVAPGNSPGILTATSINPSGGMDFTFEFSGTAPNYASGTASINDVLRLTGTTPFGAALTSANTKTLFLNMTKAELG
ncbi:MAG: LamG-like jellyroll fold domain-containing protein, partial [Planctomycetia bacterium]